MKLYPENYTVSITVPFTDLNGDAVTPTAVSAALYDSDDQLVADLGAVSFSGGDTSVTVDVLATNNQLADGVTQAGRILEVALTTAAGVITKTSSYIIAATLRLELMGNSFQTFEAAELNARDMANLAGWAVADDDTKQTALIQAFNRLTRIPMHYFTYTPDSDNDYQIPTEHILRADDWAEMTSDAFLELPVAFRRALRAAQIIEANVLLDGVTNNIAQKQRDGVISETIGDSSMMLRGGKLQLGVDYETLRALGGFIYYNYRIHRG